MESFRSPWLQSTLLVLFAVCFRVSLGNTCYSNAGCPSYYDTDDKIYCCDWGCCNYYQYYSKKCQANTTIEYCPSKTDSFSATECCDWGCCTRSQFAKTPCYSSMDCPSRGDLVNQTYCCTNNKCCIEDQFYCPDGCAEANATKCCQWGCCSDDQYSNEEGIAGCDNNHDKCPGKSDSILNKYCCKTKCCNKAEFTRKCSSNLDCPLSGDSLGSKYCCEWGCCTSSQYYTTLTCMYTDDCPGRMDNINMTRCCRQENKCCLESDFLCQFKTCNSTVGNKCCTWGCCSELQYNNVGTVTCSLDTNCPGRYDDEDKTHCCKGSCCTKAQHDRGCFTNADCYGKGGYCCQWGCCSYSQYCQVVGHVCGIDDSKCPANYGNKEDVYCCGDKCCSTKPPVCSTNDDCPGKYHAYDRKYCCKSGCCTAKEYGHCDFDSDCGGLFNPNKKLCCSDGKCCNSTKFCAEDNCPGVWDAKDDTYCCERGCCKEEEYNKIGSCKNDNTQCPGRNDSSEKKYCCDTKCCTYDEVYKGAVCKPDLYGMDGTSSDCKSKSSYTYGGYGYSTYSYCCRHRCCSWQEYYNKGNCSSNDDCPGFYDTSEKYYCCKNKTCCTVDDDDEYTYGYTKPTYFPTGAIIAIAVILKVGFWVLIFWLRRRNWTRSGSFLIFNRRRNRRLILTESTSTASLNEEVNVATFPAPGTQPFPGLGTQRFPAPSTQPFPAPSTQPFPASGTQPFPAPSTQPQPIFSAVVDDRAHNTHTNTEPPPPSYDEAVTNASTA